jgi:hypothetical protein
MIYGQAFNREQCIDLPRASNLAMILFKFSRVLVKSVSLGGQLPVSRILSKMCSSVVHCISGPSALLRFELNDDSGCSP